MSEADHIVYLTGDGIVTEELKLTPEQKGAMIGAALFDEMLGALVAILAGAQGGSTFSKESIEFLRDLTSRAGQYTTSQRRFYYYRGPA